MTRLLHRSTPACGTALKRSNKLFTSIKRVPGAFLPHRCKAYVSSITITASNHLTVPPIIILTLVNYLTISLYI